MSEYMSVHTALIQKPQLFKQFVMIFKEVINSQFLEHIRIFLAFSICEKVTNIILGQKDKLLAVHLHSRFVIGGTVTENWCQSPTHVSNNLE